LKQVLYILGLYLVYANKRYPGGGGVGFDGRKGPGKLGPVKKFQDIIVETFRSCIDAFTDIEAWNNRMGFRQLAKVLTVSFDCESVSRKPSRRTCFA